MNSKYCAERITESMNKYAHTNIFLMKKHKIILLLNIIDFTVYGMF